MKVMVFRRKSNNFALRNQKLENDVFWAAGIAQKYNCSLVRLDYQQEQGLMSSLLEGRASVGTNIKMPAMSLYHIYDFLRA